MNQFFARVKQLFAQDNSPPGCLPPTPGYPSASWMPAGPINANTGMGTSRDQNTRTLYGYPRIFSRWELENAYRQSWIAKRIVNLPPSDMTREWRQAYIEDDPDGALVQTIEDVERGLQLRKRCCTALRWGRLYGGSLMFMGIKDQPTDQPLDPATVGKGDLEWLLVLDRWHVSYNWADNYVFDVAKPTYGMPEYYMIMGTGQRWHNTRVVRFDGEELPLYVWLMNGRWSDSTLNHVLQTVLSLESAQHACLLSMQQGSLDVVSLPGMREMIAMNANGMEQIYNRIQVFSDLKSVYRVAVKDADEKIERMGAALAGYDTLFTRFQDEMCGACEIPHTVLYGQSPEGFRGTGDFDTRQYYDLISTKQESELRPQLEYLDQVLVRSALGTMPDDYSFDFNTLWQLDKDAESQIELRNAQRDHIYMTDGALQPEMVTKQLYKDQTYTTLTEDDVQLIESFNEPMEQAPPVISPETPTAVAAPGMQSEQPFTKRNGKSQISIPVTTGRTPLAP